MNAEAPQFTAYLNGSLSLTNEGKWIHEGVEFTNQKLIALFHRSIVWDAKERKYILQIGPYRASFKLEGVPYFVNSLDDTTNPWTLSLLHGERVLLLEKELEASPSHEIYCIINGVHRAKFLHGAHETLLSHTVSDTEIKMGDSILTIREAACPF